MYFLSQPPSKVLTCEDDLITHFELTGLLKKEPKELKFEKNLKLLTPFQPRSFDFRRFEKIENLGEAQDNFGFVKNEKFIIKLKRN